MKKILSLLLLVTILTTSCSSPYKKRKKCRGNGSWYGNRNLGLTPNQNFDNSITFKLN